MFPSRSSGRKRWIIHDGPRSSLRRLRNQLAEDGCAESQVVLAKQLLEEKCELETDKVSNFTQALEWLISATDQGHIEAKKLLKRCMRTPKLDEHSSIIVRAKACLAASRQETVARKAARDIFASISNGKQYITTAQLEQRIRDIYNYTVTKEAEESDNNDDSNGDDEDSFSGSNAIEESTPEGDIGFELNGTALSTADSSDEGFSDQKTTSKRNEDRNITVDNLLTAAVDYCQGELPLHNYDLTLTDPGIRSLDHIPILHQAFLHPFLFLQILYLKLLHYISTITFRLTNIEVLLLFIAYISIKTSNFPHVLPILLYYISFVAMVLCTVKMLYAKKKLIDFRKWSGLFLRYSDGNLQPDESENLFVRNNLKPFFNFFLALLVNIFVYPFVEGQWILFSEFCVVCFLLTFLSLFSLNDNKPDVLALISFGINVLAKYPYEKDTVVNKGWRFLDLQIQNLPSYLLGNGVEFCLNARVFFSLLIPIILVGMSKRDGWKGFFKYTLPHCVTLSWLQLFITCSHGATTYGLIRGTLGLVGSFLFLPLLGVFSIGLPVIAGLQYMMVTKVYYIAFATVGFGLGLWVTCKMAKTDGLKKFVTPVQLSIALIALILYSNQTQDNGLPTSITDYLSNQQRTLKNWIPEHDYDETDNYYASWDQYYNNCQAPYWNLNNMADAQIMCSILEGSKVEWEGYVKDVKIISVKNNWSDFVSYLPVNLVEILKCYFGEEYARSCQGDCDFVMGVVARSGKRCHLNRFNEYTYEAKLTMETGSLLKKHAEISVVLDHTFTNITRLLRTDDIVKFRGYLVNVPDRYNVGSDETRVNAQEIECVKCKVATGSVRLEKSLNFNQWFSSFANDFVVSAKAVLNFVLNPVLVFK